MCVFILQLLSNYNPFSNVDSSTIFGDIPYDEPFFELQFSGSKFDYDNSWIGDMFPSAAEKHNLSPRQPTYSSESAQSGCSSIFLERDPGDRGVIKYLNKDEESPQQLNSGSIDEDQGEDRLNVVVIRHLYNPMKKCPRNLLNKFLGWYRKAKEEARASAR